jgi:ATP-dependent Clp protease ATP-binding subunit ClpA
MVQKGYDPAFGARNLERSLTQQIEDRIAELLLQNKVSEGQSIAL